MHTLPLYIVFLSKFLDYAENEKKFFLKKKMVLNQNYFIKYLILKNMHYNIRIRNTRIIKK